MVADIVGAIDCRISAQRAQNAAAGHLIAVPIQDGRDIAKEQNGLGIGASGDPAYTLDTTGAQACAIQGNLIGRDAGGPQGVGASDEGAMYTLTKADVHAIATIDMQACKGNANIGDGSVSPTLCKPSGSDVHAVAFHPTQDPISSDDGTTHCIGTGSSQGCATVAVAHGSQSAVPVSDSLVRGNNQYSGFPTEVVSTSAMTVRRLTPRECERLQAFPDDYTMIPWRGKSAADCPDGPRYKALGNSMAVNCMEWIGERIAAWEKRDDR